MFNAENKTKQKLMYEWRNKSDYKDNMKTSYVFSGQSEWLANKPEE